jgi:hypothetical protein
VATKRTARVESDGSQMDPAVIEFLRELDHPLKKEIEAVRTIILGVSPEIREGIKWNAPSFRTTEYFATFNLRARGGAAAVWLILHTGAKVKETAKGGMAVADPEGILEWRGKDRAVAKFEGAGDVRAKTSALEGVIREWIRWV